MAVFISVMPFPKSRIVSVRTSVACLSILAPTQAGTAISLVRSTMRRQDHRVLTVLTEVFTHQPLPSAWGI